MKASQSRSAEYLGKVQLWFSPNSAQEVVIWQWLEEQKTAGVKLAPLIKAVLYQHITGAGQGGEVTAQLADIKAMLSRLSSGQVSYGPELSEEADDLLAKLGGIQT
jgi:hypothetical protein